MRNFLILILLTTLSYSGFSQYYAQDYGVLLGPSQFLGDMGGKDKSSRPWIMDMKLSQTRWALGGFYRYRLREKLAVNVQLNWIHLRGADSLSTYEPRMQRNLHFRNNVIELAPRAEYYFYHVNDVGHTGRYQLDFRAYAYVGVGVFYNNPQAKDQYGDWVSLRKYQTEGVKYSPIQLSIPVGAGMYYTYKKHHRIGWEFGVRKTFTDYMDDVSGYYVPYSDTYTENLANKYNPDGSIGSEQYEAGSPRGNPANNDWYMTTQFSYSYVLRGKSNFYKSKYSYLNKSKKHRKRTRAKF